MKITTAVFNLALVALSVAEAVIDLTPSNFDSVLAQKQPKLIEFFAPWCGHCKNLAPVYEELAQGFQYAKDKVVIAKVDADAHKELGSKYGVQGFPTLKWFDGDKVEDYNGGRDLDSLSSFITEKTGAKMKTNKTPSKVEMLNDRTFNKTVQDTKHVFVAFTAPWCGHCKSLAPIWEQLANDMANDPKVVIAKVDATDPGSSKIAEEQQVQGYPTLKWFAGGKALPVTYSGGRTAEAFLEYINKEAGTFRVVGGGLSAAAGTIAAIDAAIEKAGGVGSDLLAKLEESITSSSSDKYSAYYRKVAEKVQANAGYVEKEFTRLQKIIAKKTIAPEKLDDLYIRSNILQKFKEAVGAEKKTDKVEL